MLALAGAGWNVWTSETAAPAKVLFAAEVQVGQEAFTLPSLQQGQSFRVVPMRGRCVEALDAEKAVMARICNYDDHTCPTSIVPPDHTTDVPRFVRARIGEAPVVANIVVCDNLLPHCKPDCT